MEITQELLRELLEYDEETGKLHWRVRGVHLFDDSSSQSAEHRCNRWNAQFAGKQAGCHLTSRGYYDCTLGGKIFPTHRLVWVLMMGQWPTNVDHIDGDRINNSWHNLREVTHAQNSQNRGKNKNNASGVTGVGWNARAGKWHARIGQENLGTFEDFDEAVEVRKAAEKSHGYHVNHGRGAA